MTPILFVAALYAAYIAGTLRLRLRPPASRHLPATWTAVGVLGIAAVIQFAFPPTLNALRRDPDAIAGGEVWRLATALCVQDGGVAGSVFNVVTLAMLGTTAERLLGTGRWIVVFVAGGISSEIIALEWQPFGAGNSVANFSLAGAICVCGIAGGGRAILTAAFVSSAAGGVLLLMRDIHGASFFLGAALGLIVGRTRYRVGAP